MEEDSSIMDAYLMHSLNHIFRTRDLVTKNDAKVAKNKENFEEEMLIGGGFLDQGFTKNDAKVAKNKENFEEEMLIGGGFLDQGSTRPKIAEQHQLAVIDCLEVGRLFFEMLVR